jgi:hypothetical protein
MVTVVVLKYRVPSNFGARHQVQLLFGIGGGLQGGLDVVVE